MAERDIARDKAVDLEWHDFRLFGLGTEGADDGLSGRTQRSDPGSLEASPQRMDLGQGNSRMMAGHDFGDDLIRLAARLFDHRDVELALLRVGHDLRLVDGRKAGGAQEAVDRLLGRTDARALLFLADVGGAGGEAPKSSASRRGVQYSRAPS